MPALFSCISVFGQTSVNHPLPDSGAHWNYSVTGMCQFWAFPVDSYSILIDGDTVINGNVYHKLYTPIVVHGTSCTYELPGYKGAFRNDTLNRKVYYVPPSSPSDTLLYDFNLQAGDTIKGWLGSDISPSTVVSIDSVVVGNSYRRRWVLDNYSVTIIDGIGSTYGLVVPFPGIWAVDFLEYRLDCYADFSGTSFPSHLSNCQLINGLTEIPDSKPAIKLLPNPAKDQFRVEAPIAGEATMKLINTSGSVIREFKSTFHSGRSGLIGIDGLSPGIYGIDIRTYSIHQVLKLVVD